MKRTIKIVGNRLIGTGEMALEEDRILVGDAAGPGAYNPHNVRLWVIGHQFGPVCAVFASGEQDALDEACDQGMLGCFAYDGEVTRSETDSDTGDCGQTLTGLGGASEPHDLSDCWIAEAAPMADQPITLVWAIAYAAGNGQGTLER